MHTSRALIVMALLPAMAPAQWVRVPVVGSPGYRADAMLAPLPSLNCLVLFGGRAAVAAQSTQTWLFDGHTWTQHVSPVTPFARLESGLVTDLIRNRLVMFGGSTAAFSPLPLSDTWEFDGSVWTRQFPNTSPGATLRHAMAFDLTRGVTVLFGGNKGFLTWSNETWEYDGVDWTRALPPNNPGALEGAGMCYDLAQQRTVLFGGLGVLPSFVFTDTTWTYDGSDWAPLPVTGPRPPARQNARLVYDSARARCVLIGGTDAAGNGLDDTWTLDLATANWSQLTNNTTPATIKPAVAYDPARAKIVHFGGELPSILYSGTTTEFGAAAFAVGNGCPGTAGVPSHTATTTPRLGMQYDLLTSSLAAPSVAFLMFDGMQMGAIDLSSLGMPGCFAMVAPTVIVSTAGAAGSASSTLAIPGAQSLVGAQIWSQALCLDPGLNAMWLSVSNACLGTIGF
ncbi:MAG: hypothetical protein H6835_16855 [Planctomycetes bacterium]|nr:hypothetical protein [Planctomycetota bacterium]